MTPETLARWRRDPVAFIEEALVDPETGRPFVLYDAQQTFLRAALSLTPDGRLPFPELLFGAPKKSGKTALAAMALLYVIVVLGGPFAEGYCLANDEEQAQSRVFRAAARLVQASPWLRDSARVLADRIEFSATGAAIQALASDYAGAAGANPTFTVFDELWAYRTEAARRLWDERVPPPTRRVTARLTVTCAGYEGESVLLEELVARGRKGEPIGEDLFATPGDILMYWTQEARAPWQTPAWLDQMRALLRPNAFLRMIRNTFVSTESAFIEMDWYDACVEAEGRPLIADPTVPVWVGVDASVKRDATALVAVTWDGAAKAVRLVTHRVFQPSPTDPLDFEGTIEATLEDWHGRYGVRAVYFDPYQMQAVAQRLRRAGLPMVEVPQTVPTLTDASSNLFELFKGRGLRLYPADDLRLAVSRAVALETSRGWRLAKEKASHKIDVVVALAPAALGAVREGQERPVDLVGLTAVGTPYTTAAPAGLRAPGPRDARVAAGAPARPMGQAAEAAAWEAREGRGLGLADDPAAPWNLWE